LIFISISAIHTLPVSVVYEISHSRIYYYVLLYASYIITFYSVAYYIGTHNNIIYIIITIIIIAVRYVNRALVYVFFLGLNSHRSLNTILELLSVVSYQFFSGGLHLQNCFTVRLLVYCSYTVIRCIIQHTHIISYI